MLEQGTLAGVRIEAKPEPATQISAVRGTENDPCWSRFRKPRDASTPRNEYVYD